MLTEQQDAFGRQLYDYLLAKTEARTSGLIERNDGFIADSGSSAHYFSDFKGWSLLERKAIRFARGRVLDAGCGAGRHLLYLQQKGHEVVGIDNSPLAIEVCKKRGVENAVVLPLSAIHSGMGEFDTVLMLGQNFGLFGSFKGARRILKKLKSITSKRARIIATTNNPYEKKDTDNLDYHRYNREHGRMGGQLRLKVRYRKYATPWFDYLMVSREEMETILENTGWKVSRFIDTEDSHFAAIIEKEKVRK